MRPFSNVRQQHFWGWQPPLRAAPSATLATLRSVNHVLAESVNHVLALDNASPFPWERQAPAWPEKPDWSLALPGAWHCQVPGHGLQILPTHGLHF